MKSDNKTSNYWFTIEPYIHVNITNQSAILYNTLDGVTIESNNIEVIALLRETLIEENCGVVLLTHERYQQKNIYSFIRELREKFMGDIIEVAFSKGKPVQLLPYFNFPNRRNNKYDFSSIKNITDTLSEICIHLDHTISQVKLISALQSFPDDVTFNIIGNLKEVPNYHELLAFLDKHTGQKKIICDYTDVLQLEPTFSIPFSYKISISFPINLQQWNESLLLLRNHTLKFEYIFYVSSEEDCQQAELLIDKFRIEKYRMHPVFNGDNIRFFEDNVFLTKEDILSVSMSIKDFFYCQAMNKHDFGKLHIMPNGDVYANVKHPVLGNIYTDGIYQIVNKEMKEGRSWFRIRNQEPCNECVYQWLCPPPSDYEIEIGRLNLCHVHK